MEIIVALKDLKHALNVVKDTLGGEKEGTGGHPGIRFYASKKNNRIKLSTDDGSYKTEMWCDAAVKKPGTVVAMGKKLLQYVMKLDTEKATLSINKSGGLLLKSDRGQQTFQCFEEDSFNKPPKVSSNFNIELAGRIYKDLITSVAFAASKQDTNRPYLEGINFKSTGKRIEVCTTDGLTVAHIRKGIKTDPINITVTRKLLSSSLRFINDDDKVTITADTAMFMVKSGSATFYSPLFAATYPDLTATLPKDEFDLSFTVEKEELTSMLERASIMLDSKGILHFEKGKVTLTGQTETTKFDEFIMTKLQGEMKDVRVDVRRLSEAVKHIDSDMLAMGFREKKPIAIYPEGNNKHICLVAVG